MDAFSVLVFTDRAKARDLAIDSHAQDLANRIEPVDLSWSMPLAEVRELGSCPSCYRSRQSIDTLGHGPGCYFGPAGIGA